MDLMDQIDQMDDRPFAVNFIVHQVHPVHPVHQNAGLVQMIFCKIFLSLIIHRLKKGTRCNPR